MSRPRKWTNEQAAAIVAARGKITMDHVAAILGVSRNAVSGIWHRHDAKTQTPRRMGRPSRSAAVDTAEVRRMRWRGESLKSIAAKFGVSPQTIHYRVKDIPCPVEHRGRPRKAA